MLVDTFDGPSRIELNVCRMTVGTIIGLQIHSFGTD